jgi:hypothetical protein
MLEGNVDPNQLSRMQLLELAQRLSVSDADVMTRAELRAAIDKARRPTPKLQSEPVTWVSVARRLLASIVEQGLNLPDAAALIRGDTKLSTPPKAPPPVATVTLARIYAAQGHLERAIVTLDEVLTSDPDHDLARQLRQQLVARLEERRPEESRGAVAEPVQVPEVAEEAELGPPLRSEELGEAAPETLATMSLEQAAAQPSTQEEVSAQTNSHGIEPQARPEDDVEAQPNADADVEADAEATADAVEAAASAVVAAAAAAFEALSAIPPPYEPDSTDSWPTEAAPFDPALLSESEPPPAFELAPTTPHAESLELGSRETGPDVPEPTGATPEETTLAPFTAPGVPELSEAAGTPGPQPPEAPAPDAGTALPPPAAAGPVSSPATPPAELLAPPTRPGLVVIETENRGAYLYWEFAPRDAAASAEPHWISVVVHEPRRTGSHRVQRHFPVAKARGALLLQGLPRAAVVRAKLARDPSPDASPLAVASNLRRSELPKHPPMLPHFVPYSRARTQDLAEAALDHLAQASPAYF